MGSLGETIEDGERRVEAARFAHGAKEFAEAVGGEKIGADAGRALKLLPFTRQEERVAALDDLKPIPDGSFRTSSSSQLFRRTLALPTFAGAGSCVG